MDSKIEQFVAITGAPGDVARGLLEACEGNLELAVNMHMEGGGSSSSSGPSVSHQGVDRQSSSMGEPESSTDELLSPTSYEAMHGVRAPIPQTAGVLIEQDTPPGRVVRSRRLPQTVFDPFQDYRTVTGKIGGPGDASKKKNLAELFRPPYDIMYHGTFYEAKLSGQHQKKWLLVNLQDSKEFSSQVLNRDVWSNHNVKDIIRQHFVFWQIHRITDEGLKFKQLYHVSSVPYIAVIDPMTGEKMADWGALSVSAFTEAILEFLSNHQFDSIASSETKDYESVADKTEESQLEAAIQASLKDAQGSKQNTSQLVFSDDSDIDCVSLTSSDNNDPSDPDQDEVEFLGNSVGGASSTTRLMSLDYSEKDTASRHSETSLTSGYISSNGYVKSEVIVPGTGSNIGVNRKRLSHRDDDDEDELSWKLPRKMMRTEISEPCPQSNHLNSETNCKHKALKQAETLKTDTSFILFRLPDGSRLQKQFMSSSPIKELFHFLTSRGIKESEHEVVTQFPRRNLCEVNPTLTFKELGIYPRETVFVHTVE